MTTARHRPSILFMLALLVTLPATGTATYAQGGEASRDWWKESWVRDVGAYSIRSDLSPSNTNAFLRRLSDAYTMIDTTLGRPEPRTPEKLDVLAFAHRADYEFVLMRRFGINARRTGGLYFDSPRGRMLAIWIGTRSALELSQSLQHEAFHQYAYSRFGHDLPLWVNEGLATYFGAAIHTDRGFVVGEAGPRPVHAVQSAIVEGNAYQFTRMLTMTNKEWHELLETERGPLLYDQAWSMVQFLLKGDGGRYNATFLRFIALLREGYPAGHAFADSFGNNVHRAFEERWTTWMRELKPTSLATAIAHADFLAAGMEELRRRDVAVTSMDELKRRLRDMQFSWELVGNGMAVTLNAMSDAPYQIPRDARQAAPPEFELDAPSAINQSGHELELEERYPTPYTIQSRFLAPVNVKVVWVRHPKDVAHFDPVITLD